MLGPPAPAPVGRHRITKQVKNFSHDKKNPWMRAHAVGAPSGLWDFSPHPSSDQAMTARAGASGLQGVMRSTQALTIGRIVWIAAIAALIDVIGEEPVPRRSLLTAAPLLEPLAAKSGTLEHCRTELSMAFVRVKRISRFSWQLDRSPV